MKVIQCADFAAPYAGSFVPMLMAAASEGTRRGHHTAVCLPGAARGRPWLAELEAVAEVRFIDTTGGRAASMRRTLGEFRPLIVSKGQTVIHSHFTEFDMPAALTRLRRPDVVVFWHEHSPLMSDPRVRLRNRLRFTGLSPLVDQILCVSPELRAGLRERGAPERKLRDFPNAIDTERFAPVNALTAQAARLALGLAPDARVVLHFGWSWLRKGGDLMLATADRLAAIPGLVMITVVGDDPAAPLAALEDHPLIKRVVPTNNVRSLYAAADVFLSCSRAEGMPFAVMEALACGLPVVVTDLPAQRELLSGLPGAEIVGTDPDELARGLTEMLALSEALRREHTEQARARIESTFALDAWARRLVDLYEDALAARAR
jgi:glycosyltransferase involved in cell wall biosynthesis